MLTITIPQEKWQEIITLAKKWLNKRTATLKEVQQLAGSLNFACICVKSGRVYLSCILNYLRTFTSNEKKCVTAQVRKDIQWWVMLSHQYNGISLMTELEWSQPDAVISSDSCLRGGGAFLTEEGQFLHWEYPQSVR